MNRWEGVGGLTRDPETSTLPSGATSWFCTIAVNGAQYDPETRGQKVTTTYVALSVVGFLAEQYAALGLGKGDEVHVIGALVQYEKPKPDGSKERKTQVRPWVLNVTRRSRSNQARSQTTQPAPAETPWPVEEPPPFPDEPPF